MDNLSEIRTHIRSMPGYEPVHPVKRLAEQYGLQPEQILKLDANENPYAPFSFIQETLAGLTNTNRYPDPECVELRSSLADYLKVPARNILAGAGADDLIDLTMRLFLEPGDVVINCPPTFGMYGFDADLVRAQVISIPRKFDFKIDMMSIEHTIALYHPKLLFITSPNNPDGSLLDEPDLERLLKLPVILVLDEAYVEFAPPGSSAIHRVTRRENLVVLRTFSKWAGLAGLRLGYGVYPDWMMEQLWKIKQPYSVSVAAEQAGVVSIRQAEELNRIAGLIISERERLLAGLRRVEWLRPYSSQSNFILCRVKGKDAIELKQALAKQGILIRYFNKPGLTDCIRISVGRPQDTDRVLQALANL
jgi:histidinol-phosphate aminotransferase